MSVDDVSVPRSAYPRVFHDFDSSYQNIDDVEGDISLSRNDVEIPSDEDLDSSFDEILDPQGRRGSVFKEESLKSSRKSSIFKEIASPKPRGYEFKLKNTQCNVYLTYPSTSIEIDNYGKVEYELKTKEKSMVVIIPNSKGLSVNNKKLADAYAIRTGCVTALVDTYFNDPLNLETPAEETDDGSFISKFKSLTVGVAMNMKLNYWLQCHNVFGAYSEGHYQNTSNWISVQECIKELLSIHGVENSVIIGFSFGANAVARLAIESDDNRIKSTIIVHPIFMPPEVFETVQKPTLLIIGREDNFYTKQDLEKFEKDLADKKNNRDFRCVRLKFHKDTPHGFSIAGDYSPMKIGDLPSRTCEEIVSWVLERF
jgi:dienelactone hydrolase